VSLSSFALLLWKSIRSKPNAIPVSDKKCSPCHRNRVRLHNGILFGITPEWCSASDRNRVRLRPDSPPPRSRQVLGVMNDFAYVGQGYLYARHGVEAALEASLKLAEMPSSPIAYESPGQLTKSLFENCKLV
jgi:hypothetical protein